MARLVECCYLFVIKFREDLYHFTGCYKCRKKGEIMTDNINPDDNPLLNPKFDLRGENPDIKGFLAWLFDPEVDKAFQEAFPIDDNE